MSSSGQTSGASANDFAHALAWYGGGLALLGGAIGYFVGASRSPVVGAALPLLFGLASGAGGLYLAKADLSTKVTRQKLQLFGRTLIAFVVLLVFGTFIGISFRTGIGLTSMFSGLWAGSDRTAVDASQMHPLDAVRTLMLRRNLQVVGASDLEQDIIIRAAGTGTVIPFDRARVSAVLADIAAKSAKLGESIPVVAPRASKLSDGTETILLEDQQEADLVNEIRALSLSLAREAGYFGRLAGDAGRQIPVAVLNSRIGYFTDQLTNSAQSETIDRWMSENGGLSDAIYDLELELIAFRTELVNTTVSIVDQANEEISTFLGPRAEASQLYQRIDNRALAAVDPVEQWFNN